MLCSAQLEEQRIECTIPRVEWWRDDVVVPKTALQSFSNSAHLLHCCCHTNGPCTALHQRSKSHSCGGLQLCWHQLGGIDCGVSQGEEKGLQAKAVAVTNCNIYTCVRAFIVGMAMGRGGAGKKRGRGLHA